MRIGKYATAALAGIYKGFDSSSRGLDTGITAGAPRTERVLAGTDGKTRIVSLSTALTDANDNEKRRCERVHTHYISASVYHHKSEYVPWGKC